MLIGKEIKKVFPYFNKIITATQKEKSLMEVKVVRGQLIFTLLESASLSIIYTISTDINDFNGLLFDYKTLASAFSKVKAKDEVEITRDEHRLKICVNDEEKYVVSTSESTVTGTKIEFICETTEYNLLKSIEENKVFSSRGSMEYNDNLFFSLKDDTLNIYNTNDIAMVLNSIKVENAKGDFTFAISNDDVSTVYKWINAIKNLKIEIALSDTFVFFKTKNEALKLSRTQAHNFNAIIKNFENVSNVKLNMVNEEKLINVKKSIFEEANKLDKENNILVLGSDFKNHDENKISLAKKLFVETIKSVSEDSIIGLIDNPLKPILITNVEEGLNHKIIFNTIN